MAFSPAVGGRTGTRSGGNPGPYPLRKNKERDREREKKKRKESSEIWRHMLPNRERHLVKVLTVDSLKQQQHQQRF